MADGGEMEVEVRSKAEIFEERKKAAENFFLENPPSQDTVGLEDGAQIKVVSSLFLIPDELKTESADTFRISIYSPGMFQADRPNFGNHPLESKLAGTMLAGNVDMLCMLKGEGLNDLAYKDLNGDGRVQEKVSAAAVSTFINKLEGLKKDGKIPEGKKIEIDVTGFSEGSTQAASIAARLVEKGYFVKGFTSIDGAGLVGANSQNEASPWDFVVTANKDVAKAPVPPEKSVVWTNQDGQSTEFKSPVVIEKPDTMYVNWKVTKALEDSLGRARVDTVKGDLPNIGRWVVRLANTYYPKILSGLAAELGASDQVPLERLKAACTKNKDYELLAKRGVPIVVFSNTEDPFFPNIGIRNEIDRLREEIAGSKIILVSSAGKHDLPHSDPSGMAYMLEMAKQKFGVK